MYMYLFGCKFMLQIDHKPLLGIYAPDCATTVLATAHLQRWSLVLSLYQYEIEFKLSAETAALIPCPDHHCRYSFSVSEIACLKSSPSRGSRNDSEWLVCLLLYHSWAQAILPPQGWAPCGARLSDVESAYCHTYLLTRTYSEWNNKRHTQELHTWSQLPAVMFGGLE